MFGQKRPVTAAPWRFPQRCHLRRYLTGTRRRTRRAGRWCHLQSN